jgi:hypothetical protein
VNEQPDLVAMGAARRLSIDVANLTMQLALLQATVETVAMAAQGINPDSWTDGSGDGETGNGNTPILIPIDQAMQIQALLVAIHRLV